MADIKSTDTISVQRLRELIAYDPATGALTWKVCKAPRLKPGALAGYRPPNDYVLLMIDGKHLKGHRVAWALAYGEWPSWPIDHIDGNRGNNAIGNLRELTFAGNAQNVCEPRKSNKTGFLGVWKKGTRFAAEIKAQGVVTRLGLFDTPEEASAAYRAAKLKLHTEALM
jgi:hypothetical protein